MVFIWRITKPCWGTGKTVIMDSYFCVLKGLIYVFDGGLYGIALVNKIIYSRTIMYGYGTNSNLEKKNRSERMPLRKPEGHKLYVFVVKDTNQNVIMMSTYSGLMVHKGKKEEYKMSKIKFYMLNDVQPFDHQYLYI